jgi:hypothetical protein
MEKFKRALRLTILIFLMLLASLGMSITGAAPVIPKHKETIMDDETRTKKEKSSEIVQDDAENEDKQ